MKKTSLVLSLCLLLSGCGAQTQLSNDGKVVSCLNIKIDQGISTGTNLNCLDGKSSVVLESIKGPALINIWGSWCAPCRQELPLLRSAYRSGKVKIIGIDVDEPNIQNGKDFAIKAGITWPNFEDPSGKTKSAFGMGVPVTWFLNSDGVVTYKHIGIFSSKSQLENEIKKYL